MMGNLPVNTLFIETTCFQRFFLLRSKFFESFVVVVVLVVLVVLEVVVVLKTVEEEELEMLVVGNV